MFPVQVQKVGNPALDSEYFAGIHFTGSTPVFQNMWKVASQNLPKYKSYPRLVGETGGKDFIFAHASSDVKALGTALIRDLLNIRDKNVRLLQERIFQNLSGKN